MADDKKTDQATPEKSEKKPAARKKAAATTTTARKMAPKKTAAKKPARKTETKAKTPATKPAAAKKTNVKANTNTATAKTVTATAKTDTPTSETPATLECKAADTASKPATLKAGSFGKAAPTRADQSANSAPNMADQTQSPLPENRLTMPEENALIEKEETPEEAEATSAQASGFNAFIIIEDIAAAMMLLTRIPVPWRRISQKPPNLSRSAWAYPLVGFIISLIGAFIYAIVAYLNLSPMLAALLAVLAMVLTTGAFHEDGLADMADGIGGGMTKDKKLEIMRDSRVGTYGAVALILSIMIRVETLDTFSYMAAILAIISAAPLSRAMIVLALYLLPPAREKGLGTVAGEPPRAAMIAALIIGIIPLILLWSPISILLAVMASIIALILVSRIAMKSVDGYTGDILGAIQQVSEAAIMIALLIAYKNVL
jgi:adenosylcobinamide-GDP ribazoletransferase